MNNLIYNPATNAIQLSYALAQLFEFDPRPQLAELAIVGNVLRHGPDTRGFRPLPLVSRHGRAWLKDNAAYNQRGREVRTRTIMVRPLDEKPVWPEGLKPLPADQLEQHILPHVGARPWDRDTIDKRILETVRERNGAIIDSQEAVGGYPGL